MNCAPFGSGRAVLPTGTGQSRGSDHLVGRWPARLGRCTMRVKASGREGRKGVQSEGQRCLPTTGLYSLSVTMIRLIALHSRSLALPRSPRIRRGVEGAS